MYINERRSNCSLNAIDTIQLRKIFLFMYTSMSLQYIYMATQNDAENSSHKRNKKK